MKDVSGVENLHKVQSKNETNFVNQFKFQGAMTQQFHLAFSKDVHGAAIFAGIPYTCGRTGEFWKFCMGHPETLVNVSQVVDEIRFLASTGKLDGPSNLESDPVFIFHGINDQSVHPNCRLKIKEIYQTFGARVTMNFEIAATHGFPTKSNGAPCSSDSADNQYINNCNYDGAYEALQHLYPEEILKRPGENTPLLGDLIEFDQAEFTVGVKNISMDSTGLLYVASACKNVATLCRLHIAFHGCTQSKSLIGYNYVTKTGYLEVAELNNVIVLFPQTTNDVSAGNSLACWDWWGFSGQDYLTKVGAQMTAVHKMLQRIVGHPTDTYSAVQQEL